MATVVIERFWSDFVAATGIDGEYTAWGFGATPQQATELGLLVRDGAKRATAGLVAAYETDGDAVPNPGDLGVILDGSGTPLCVIRTTELTVKPLGEVDEAFAWDEGEGDRSLAWWKQAHVRFFERLGYEIDDASPMVLERFELLWAPEDGVRQEDAR